MTRREIIRKLALLDAEYERLARRSRGPYLRALHAGELGRLIREHNLLRDQLERMAA